MDSSSSKERSSAVTSSPSYVLVTASIVFYCFISISIIFVNRHLFTGVLPYPVFISWFQQCIGAFVLGSLSLLKKTGIPGSSVLPAVALHRDVAIRCLPLAVTFVGMVGFANACLKYVQISTYQTARSLTLVFNLLFSRLILDESHSLRAWAACSIVICGFAVGSMDASTLSMGGLALGSLSSLCQALYSVIIKKCLPLVNGDVTALLFYNLCLSSVLFVPCIFLAGETEIYYDLPLAPREADFWEVWAGLLQSGILGMLVTLASYLCIKLTSPVTFNIVGYSKACLQSIGGIAILGDIVTSKSVTGISMTLAGSFWYSRVKLGENLAASSESHARRDEEDESTFELKKHEEGLGERREPGEGGGGGGGGRHSAATTVATVVMIDEGADESGSSTVRSSTSAATDVREVVCRT